MFVLQDHRPPGARTSPPINWSDSLVHRLRRQPIDRIVHRSLLLNAHFAVDQLNRLFVVRASLAATPVTPRRTDTSCSRTKWAHFTTQTSSATSALKPICLRRGLLAPRCLVIASDTGDSSLLGARSSPATSRTPRSSVLRHRQ